MTCIPMKRKYTVSTDTILKVGLDCNENFGCLDQGCCKRVDGVVVCEKPEYEKCKFRFGTSLPDPMCMCWVKTEKESNHCQ